MVPGLCYVLNCTQEMFREILAGLDKDKVREAEPLNSTEYQDPVSRNIS